MGLKEKIELGQEEVKALTKAKVYLNSEPTNEDKEVKAVAETSLKESAEKSN